VRRLVLLFAALAVSACDRVPKLGAVWNRLHPARVEVAAAPPAPIAAPAPATAPKPPATDGILRVEVTLHGPLERELAAQVGPETAPALALVMQRLTLWWMDRNDERPGDRISALYELPAGHEPVVHALRYTSQKLGKTFAAYEFQAKGAPFPRYYTADGVELEERLRNSPVAEYEQVTSFLKDGRHHHGIDFKCPVGTPVRMPFDGTLVRKNWNWRGNGNCLELVDAKTGRHAKFLHLSPLPASLKPGMHFKAGQQVALSGNTGHTTAPHLHYQLESPANAILDPFAVQQTYREQLPAAELPAFQAAAHKLEARLTTAH